LINKPFDLGVLPDSQRGKGIVHNAGRLFAAMRTEALKSQSYYFVSLRLAFRQLAQQIVGHLYFYRFHWKTLLQGILRAGETRVKRFDIRAEERLIKEVAPMTVVRKAILCLTLSAMLFVLSSVAQAQQPAKIPRIGWLTIGFLSTTSARQEAFRQGLRELGYVEGKNILIEWRGADNIPERRRALAEELVRLKVDVIVTGGSGATRPAKQATSTIPIVMASDDDPVGSGFVASLARPVEASLGYLSFLRS
jgi:ABC transporter substrate binding protein